MAKEICISTTPHETRLAILEDEQLAEIYYERENEYTLAGSIYKGRVTRVLPGMQSSFVDVGLERDAFLYVTDFLEEQEDSEEFGGEPSGRRAATSRGPDEAQAGEERSERGERGERPDRSERGSRPERSGDRGGDRNADRGGDRNSDRNGGRRPAAAAAAPVQQPAESAREGGRAGRERTREQAIAPLREAVPAAQDLEEQGDEESPTGTRRWRGRRGRRRGVRGGLADPRPLPNSTPEALEEAGAAEYEAAAPFVLAEHGAPGGVADLHASPETSTQAEPEQHRPADAAPRREPGRGGSRDRSSRRQREPYAQASTVHASTGQASTSDRHPAPQPGREPELHASAAAGPVVPVIVLPGESLSKYGSAPVDPALTAAPTATAPRPAGRPVNYIAPKPSTLVELSDAWDGGAVLPGETLSRYRGSAAERPEPLPAAEIHAAELPVQAGLDQVEGVDQVDAPATHLEPDHRAEEIEETAERALAPRPDTPFGAHEHQPEHAAPLAEPEMMAEALPSSHEPSASVSEPEIVHPGSAAEPVANLAGHEPSAATEEPAEYEPENASASYRVDPAGTRELRIAGPDEEEQQVEQEAPAATLHAAEYVSEDWEHAEAAPVHADEFPAALAEPSGRFADAQHEVDVQLEATAVSEAEPVAHLAGELEQSAPEYYGQDVHQSYNLDSQNDHQGASDEVDQKGYAGEQPSPAPRLLYEEGSVETLPTFNREAHGFDLGAAHGSETAEYEEAAAAGDTQTQPATFAEMVDRLQGFAPGHGLLEEETIEEEEYDFEPMHAHTDEHDQEDLEEETLDHQIDPATLSDAVRDSYLEQRVHQLAAPKASLLEEAEEAHSEAESRFGSIEISEDEEDSDEEEGEAEGEEPGEASGDAQRAPRSGEERSGRGRGGPSRGGRSAGGRRGGPGRGRSAQTQDLPIISDMLKQGQEILVQIAKEPIAKKGARITSHIALPGRFLVFMPTVSHVGVSRKIASDEERQRLKRILVSEKGDASGGFIVRTAAEGASEEDLRADLRFLISLWTEIKQRSETAKAPALIYHDLNLIERILRDQVSSNFSTIWVDSEAEYERIIRFLNRFQPALVRRVKLYTKETPLFEHFGIQEEISKALKSKVWLKSGGSIVINQTEALVAIDINTGKYVGKTARLEDTIVKTNLDAIPEIVRQIRLRDLGGIIVIDFIDMDERKNRNRVLAALEEELKHDRAPSKVLQFNDFGLVAITRKRVKQSLERTLSVTCETCTGTGMVKSPITVCNEIYIEMRKMIKHLDGKDVMLRVHPEVVKQLKAGNGKWINELEELVAKTIIIKSDPALHPEQFDIH